MQHMRFTGFKQLCESDFEKSNMTKILARDLNIVPGSNDKSMDSISPGSAIEFKGGHLKSLNKLLGIEDHDVAMKLIRVINRNDYGVQIEDVSGACDNQGLNTGRGIGRFADRPFPHMPCSPTNGQKWWVSAKDWDHIQMPLPPGGGAAGGGGPPMGGMGGPPMGGPPMGGPPPGGPPGAGGAAPPPPI